MDSAADVSLDAQNTSSISALVATASASLAISGTAGVGVSIGLSVARNSIGWDLHDNYLRLVT